MTDTSFTMSPQRAGRMKYLLLTLACPILLSYILRGLVQYGIIPRFGALPIIHSILISVPTLVGGYFLIFQKLHVLEVQESGITNKDWRGKTFTVQTNQIRSWRRNLLAEIFLLDENGKVLLCVESNMSNFDLFQQWLQEHHINESNRGDFR